MFLHYLSLAVWWGPQWCALPAVWPLLHVSELTTDVWFWIVAADLSALPHFHARTNCSGGGLSNCARSAQMPQFACLPFPSADGAVLAVLVTQ